MYAELVTALSGRGVLVIGDVMLDEYIWGRVQRISPEAPVPIVEIQHRTYLAGGAANVATNVVSLGGRVLLGGVVGRDNPAIELRKTLDQCGVDTMGLMVDEERPTTLKTRIIAHNQQVVRVDAERRMPLSENVEERLLTWIEKALPFVSTCVLSDYGKGVVSPQLAQYLIKLASQQGKPVIVDPKGSNYSKYRGATLITPNLLEAKQAAKLTIDEENDLRAISRQLLALLEGSALLITQGMQGMSLFQTGADRVHIPAMAQTVFDVTGAGDTVISTLALALAAQIDLNQAVRLANLAASIVVGKVGTATVTMQELLDICKQY